MKQKQVVCKQKLKWFVSYVLHQFILTPIEYMYFNIYNAKWIVPVPIGKGTTPENSLYSLV